MKLAEAVQLIEGAIPRVGGTTWADVGAGDGTFTRALAEVLGPGSRIYAIDRDAAALATLERRARRAAIDVVPVVADFTRPFEMPGLGDRELDGMLIANALHYVEDPEPVLGRLVEAVRSGGRVVIVEYDRRRANRWVPFPIAPDRLSELAASAGLSTPIVTATRSSAYGGDLYVAAADRMTDARTKPAPRHTSPS